MCIYKEFIFHLFLWFFIFGCYYYFKNNIKEKKNSFETFTHCDLSIEYHLAETNIVIMSWLRLSHCYWISKYLWLQLEACKMDNHFSTLSMNGCIKERLISLCYVDICPAFYWCELCILDTKTSILFIKRNFTRASPIYNKSYSLKSIECEEILKLLPLTKWLRNNYNIWYVFCNLFLGQLIVTIKKVLTHSIMYKKYSQRLFYR